MNIPRFLQLYKEDRLEDAFEAVIMDNPLPSSTGECASIRATAGAVARPLTKR